MLERLLRSKAEVRVLGIVLFEDGLHLREIARRADVSPFEAKRELENLVELGLLQSKRKGNQVIFQAEKDCPFLTDLKNLYQKTEGVFSQLQNVLKAVVGIKYAFIFGSVAASKEKQRNDIDLLIIGEVNEDEIAERIFKVQRTMKREINFILWTTDDFKEKIKKKSSFLQNAIKNKIIFLVGDERELIRIVEKKHDKEG